MPGRVDEPPDGRTFPVLAVAAETTINLSRVAPTSDLEKECL